VAGQPTSAWSRDASNVSREVPSCAHEAAVRRISCARPECLPEPPENLVCLNFETQGGPLSFALVRTSKRHAHMKIKTQTTLIEAIWVPQSTQVATSNCTCAACMRHASVTCVCLVRLARGPRGQAPKNVGNTKEAWTRKTMARLARAVVLDGVRGRMARKHHVSPSWHRSRPC